MNVTLTRMAEGHRQAVMDIYNHFVDHDFAAYREKRLPYAAYDRFLSMAEGYPAYAAIDLDGAVLGFGFLHPWHPAECFARTAEITYFLAADRTHRGIGSALLSALLEGAAAKGVDRILASISSRNEASLAFHRKHGFEVCGRFETVGRKFGEDFDVVWMMKRLVPVATAPGASSG
ncbi:MAG TPA: GNAT family N-acetyltransferase [Vicinamibacterales bacterium]|nr:GNAT family N-acetyltransferase [Vicinamibacterales bacterium]